MLALLAVRGVIAVAPTMEPTPPPNLYYRSVVDGFAIVDARNHGCNTSVSGIPSVYENPTRILVPHSSSMGSSRLVWQAQYNLITALIGNNRAPLYVWLNVSSGPSIELRYVDVWVCDEVVAVNASADNQLFRWCGPDITHLSYPVPCSDTTTPYKECYCGNEWVQTTNTSCDDVCGNCTEARFHFYGTIPPTPAPFLSPTYAPSAPPTPNIELNCSAIVMAGSFCGSEAPIVDHRDDVVCIFTVNPGSLTLHIPMNTEIQSCTCDMYGTNLSEFAGAPSTYTFTCTGAEWKTEVETTTPSVNPVMNSCPFLRNTDPWTMCIVGKDLGPYTTCTTSLDCAVGLSCRNSSTANARCLRYEDCTAAEKEDNTKSPNACAPIDTINNNITTWCKENDFWEVGNYTVPDTITTAWDPSSLDSSVNDAIVAALEPIYQNATAFNQTLCVCTDTRMEGWTPHLVMIQHTLSPVPATTTIMPTLPITSAPITAAPVTSTPTGSTTTHTPTSAPTNGPAYIPLIAEMCSSSNPDTDYSICSVPNNPSLFAVFCSAAPWDTGSCSGAATDTTFTCIPPLGGTLVNHQCDDAVQQSQYVHISEGECIFTHSGEYGLCVNTASPPGVAITSYCKTPHGKENICTEEYACDGANEVYYGADINRTLYACSGTAPTFPPTAPTHAPSHTPTGTPTTKAPSHPPTHIPTATPTAYYPYVVNLNNTVREYYAAYDAAVQYVWGYRLRGPYLVYSAGGEAEAMTTDNDVLWPTSTRCENTPSCSVMGVVNFIPGLSEPYGCSWLCVQFQAFDDTIGPINVRASTTLNRSTCSLPGYSWVNTVILSVFIISAGSPNIEMLNSDIIRNTILWTPWINMTEAWINASDYDRQSCGSDIAYGCIGNLVYYESYTAWRASRTELTQTYLDNMNDTVLKENVPRLYPDFNVTWGVFDPTGKAITYPSSQNYLRVWSLYASYQTVTMKRSSPFTGACVGNQSTSLYGMYLHATSDPGSNILGNPQISYSVRNGTSTNQCGYGNTVCGSGPGGHPSCGDIQTKAECARVPLCTPCDISTTTSPVPFTTETTPPTPALNPPTMQDVNIVPLVVAGGIIVVIVLIVVVVLGVMAIVRIAKREPSPRYEGLVAYK